MAIISCGTKSLPRSLDVSVNVSKTQVEGITDLSILAALVTDSTFDFDAGRVRYYSTLAAVQGDSDVPSGSQGELMAIDFFSQSPRPDTMAIAQVFTAAQSGFLLGNTLGANLAGFKLVNDGEFRISIDGAAQNITAMNFTSATSLNDVAVVIEGKLQAVASGGYTAAQVKIVNNQVRITSGTTGASSVVSFLSTVTSPAGTDISKAAYLAGTSTDGGKIVTGYVPSNLVSEAALIQDAARCNGKPIYGWTLQTSYRDTQDQIDFSGWVEALELGIAGLQSNNALAKDAGTSTDLGSVLKAAGYDSSFAFYDDKVAEFPEVGGLAYMLHVDYFAENSTVTAKFKNLSGITPVDITESELTVLENKRYNVFTLIGNNSRTIRDGVQSSDIWYMDDRINLDNYKEHLQVDIYNVFLREKKVPYTQDGVGLLHSALAETSQRFVFNGTLADRPVVDLSRKSGERIDPAYTITIQPLATVSASQRAARTGPPATIDANLAGAIHSLSINVQANG